MARWLKRKPFFMLGLGLAMGLFVGVGMFAGAFVATGLHSPQPEFVMPEFPLHAASGGHGNDGFAMCTGNINEDVDALYTIDFLTGDLRCFVFNPNAGAFTGLFETNVNADLGIEKGKKANFAIVTGGVSWKGGITGPARPGNTLVYVADVNTGNFAAYGLYQNRQATLQKDALRKVAIGKGRVLAERDR